MSLNYLLQKYRRLLGEPFFHWFFSILIAVAITAKDEDLDGLSLQTDDYDADYSDISSHISRIPLQYSRRQGAIPPYRVRFNAFPWIDLIAPVASLIDMWDLSSSEDDYDLDSLYSDISHTISRPSEHQLLLRKRIEQLRNTILSSSENGDQELPDGKYKFYN